MPKIRRAIPAGDGAAALLRFPERAHAARRDRLSPRRPRQPLLRRADCQADRLGRDARVALAGLRAALAKTRSPASPATSICCSTSSPLPEFAAQGSDTGFIARHHDALSPSGTPPAALVAAALSILDAQPRPSADPHSPWQLHDGWRLGNAADAVFRFHAADETHEVRIAGRDRCAVDGEPVDAPGDAAVTQIGNDFWVVLPDATARLTFIDPLAAGEGDAASTGKIVAPMPGKVTAVLISPGAAVKRGERLMLIEAMKMEHAVVAPADGTVAVIHFAAGALVEEGIELLTLEARTA